MQLSTLMNKKFLIRIIFLFILLFIAVLSVSFYLRYQEINNLQNKILKLTQENSYLKTLSTNTNESQQKENSLSFAKTGDEIVLQYKNKIYKASISNTTREARDTLIEIALDKNIYQWHKLDLLDSPKDGVTDIITDTDIWDFRLLSDRNQFIFIVSYDGENKNYDSEYSKFYIYLYNGFYLQKLYFTTIDHRANNQKSFYSIPTVYQISKDAQYVAFRMHNCWGCSSNPHILILNMQTLDSKWIDKRLSYFKLLNNGKYEYKEKVEIECKVIKETQYGQCFEELQNIPFKYGQF